MSTVCLQEIQNQIEKNIRCDIFYSFKPQIVTVTSSKGKDCGKNHCYFSSVFMLFLLFMLFLFIYCYFSSVFTLFFVAPLPSPYLTLEKY